MFIIGRYYLSLQHIQVNSFLYNGCVAFIVISLRFYVVRWEHASFACALNRARHPALVDDFRIHDDVALYEGDFIIIGRLGWKKEKSSL